LGVITFANDTTGQCFSITLAPPTGASFNGSTIEWVMEAPDNGEPTSSMPKFTPIAFTSALGQGTDGKTVGDPKNGDNLVLTTASRHVLTSTTLAEASVTIDFVSHYPATPKSPLTCFGVGGSATRVYFLDSNGHVNELAWEGIGWRQTDVTSNAAGAPKAAAGSGLTCFGVGGSATRVYYVDTTGHLNEIAWQNNGWFHNNTPAAAATTSPLTCFGVGSSATRVYYLDQTNHVFELAWENNSWGKPTNVTVAASAPPPAAGTSLTCFGVGGSATRVYYVDTTGRVIELAWENNGWKTNLTPATHAAPNSLSSFGVGGSATRVYYLDQSNHVCELAWENSGWVLTPVASQAEAPPAAAGSALTCFGVDGSATRVYYVDTTGHMNELAWENSWVRNVTLASGVATSALTCFGVGGSATRVYYLDKNHLVNELAWENPNWAVAIIG
jgi:hypothetical protein